MFVALAETYNYLRSSTDDHLEFWIAFANFVLFLFSDTTYMTWAYLANQSYFYVNLKAIIIVSIKSDNT